MTTRPSSRPSSIAAFTLVELLVVIAIMAILISIIVPGVTIGIRKAKLVVCKTNLKNMHNALFAYGADEDLPGTFPRFGGTTVDAPHEGNLNSFRVMYPSNPVLAIRERGQYIKDPKNFFCPLYRIDVDTYFNPEPGWVETTFWGSYTYYYRHVPGSEEIPLRPGNNPNTSSGANRNDMTSVGAGSEDTMLADATASYFRNKGFTVDFDHYNVLFGDGGLTSFTTASDLHSFLATQK